MPLIYEAEEREPFHNCVPPSSMSVGHYNLVAPREFAVGSIWKCDCDRYWHVTDFDFGKRFNRWIPVYWYNFGIKKKIKELENERQSGS